MIFCQELAVGLPQKNDRSDKTVGLEVIVAIVAIIAMGCHRVPCVAPIPTQKGPMGHMGPLGPSGRGGGTRAD